MSRSAFSLATSRLSRAISSCSGFIWPWPGKACCGSSANFFTLADLDGADNVGRVHLAEALSYRALVDDVRRAA
jgi:predicted ATPase with chaperone activity